MSSCGFLRRGDTRDSLNTVGNSPEESDRLMIFVMTGTRTEEHCLSNVVGIGSRLHCLLGASWISLETSSSVAGAKEERRGGLHWGSGKCGFLGGWALLELKVRRSLEILSEKNEAKCCATEAAGIEFGVALGGFRWRMVFTVCQRRRGSEDDELTRLE